ncbi:hypothetical protein [Streptomyces sp. SudanB182_2057]
MATQTRTDTFAALRDCFAADLAALIGDQASLLAWARTHLRDAATTAS